MSSSAPAAQPTVRRPGDTIFSSLTVGAGILILLTLAGVAFFLIAQAIPAFTADPEDVFGGEGLLHLIGPMVFGTILSSVIALVIAMPLSIGIGIFISHYAPRRLAQALGYVVDLLAAVPSIVFGLWGAYTLAPQSLPIMEWLNSNLGWVPLFSGNVSSSGRTMLVGAVVLAIMILPIMTAVNREVFLQTPKLQEEAALGLGATRWEMIRLTVLPYGRSGVISGAMLGLGRALGETMALAIIVSSSGRYAWSLVSDTNAKSIASGIALGYPEAASDIQMSSLIAAGLVLFAITLVVNMLARYISTRGQAGGN